MKKGLCLLLSAGFLVSPELSESAPSTTDLHKAVSAAQKWLTAKPEDRAALEPILMAYRQDIDVVIDEIRPKGSPEFAKNIGREIKGETFVVPRLLKRNDDHPFNYYVPPHYDSSKPMGLILWMHGGGTYKPGKNVKRRSV